MRAPKRTLAATMLALEAFVVFFAGLVARNLSGTSPTSNGTALAVCGALAVACLLAAGLLRSPLGYWLGWGLQLAVIGTGFLVTSMFFVGWIFALLWFAALRVGTRIERDQALIAARRAQAPPPS